MASKWQKKITVTAGTPTYVELPSTVGAVMVVLDFAGSGTGTASETFYEADEAIADAGGIVWSALTGIDAAVADANAVATAQASVLKLEAATTDQVFILTGETHA